MWQREADRRLRVLLIAEAANPEWVSVPLVGWLHARAIARLVDAHLVTQVRNRQEILRAGLVEGRDFTAIDSEAVARPLFRLASLIRGESGVNWTTNTALAGLWYYHFEQLVWKRFGEQIVAGRFDIIHRLTPLSPTIPSLMAGKCRRAGVPFVLGPLNGGVAWPRQFDAARRKEREWLSYVRGAYRLLPGYRSTLHHAAVIFVGSKATWRQIPKRYQGKCVYLAENAIDPQQFSLMRTRRAGRPIRLAFAGRLVPYKGADMLIEAAAELLRSGEATLEIIGDGPEKEGLIDLARRRQVEQAVHFAGWLPHERVQDRLAEADVFAFPSVREFGGGAVLEAMAAGLAPVVLNYGGPGELVTDDSGCLVEMGTRAEVIERFRSALDYLADHPEQIDLKAAAAMRRAREQFTWETKARTVVAAYRRTLGLGEPEAAGAVGLVAQAAGDGVQDAQVSA